MLQTKRSLPAALEFERVPRASALRHVEQTTVKLKRAAAT
jgi:hypothetical protein